MNSNALLDPELILLDTSAETKEEIMVRLAKLMIAKGYAKESYADAILEREKVFPTGLPTEVVGVALPHTDVQHVIKPGIGMAVLKEPVKFNVMGNSEEEVDVNLIFMLALTDPNSHLQLLSDLTDVFQNNKLLEDILKANDTKTIASLINNFLATKQNL